MTNIHPTALVDSKAELGEGVEIGPWTFVGPNVRIGAGSRIMSHVVLTGWTTIGSGCEIFPFASIGTQCQDLKYKGAKTTVSVGNKTVLREYVTVNASTEEGEETRVGAGCFIMAYCHVAHQCHIGNGVIMANCTQLAGHVEIEDMVGIGGMVGVHQFVRMGTMAFIGGLSRISQDVPPFMLVEGNPPAVHGINAVGLKRREVPPETREILKKAHRIIWRENLSTTQAIEKVKIDLEMKPELERLVKFIESSERGIIK